MRALLLCLALLAVACTQPEAAPPQPTTEADITLSGPVAISLWHALTGTSEKALAELVAKFNSTNPLKITVTAQYQGSYAQLEQKTIGAIQSGTLPELGTGFESLVADVQRAGVVVALDPYLASRKNGISKADLDDLVRPFLDGGRYAQYANQLLGFPFQRAVFAMYANDSILREVGRAPPRSWAEFEDIARAAVKRGTDGRVTRYGWAVTMSASTFEAWVISRGGKLVSDDGRAVAWDGPAGADALRSFQKLLAEGTAYVPKGFDYQTDFASGKVAFVQESSAFRPFIASGIKPPLAWSIRPIPQSDATRPRTIAYGPSFIVYKSTTEKQLAAWLFVRWFSERAQTAEWAAATSTLPARRSAVDAEPLKTEWAREPQAGQAGELADTSVPEPNVRGQQDVRSAIEDLLVLVASRPATDVDKALKDAAAKANAILKSYQ